MMKAALFLIICLTLPRAAFALDIQELLDAVARQPGYEISRLTVLENDQQKQRITAALFPRLGAFGRAEVYNSPTNLKPVTPTEAGRAAFGESVPFSEEILRYGLSFDVPVYVHAIYVARSKSELLRLKSRVDRQLDILGRQAAVVSLNSALAYLQGLDAAIAARSASLSKTLADMKLKVKIGRSSESELVKIKKSLNDLDQQRNALTVKRLDAVRELYALTGVQLAKALPMTLVHKPEGADYLPVAAAKYNADAAQKEVERRQAAHYPAVSATGFISGNDGTAYNTDDHINRTYNAAALVLKFPLFDRSLSTDVGLARIQAQKAQKKLAQIRIDTAALADSLNQKLPVLEKSIDLARQSVADSQTLLDVAKVAVQSGRMTLEDYLRYESDVLSAQATLYQAKQQRWQVLSQQAALYGTDLKGVVK